MKKNTVMLIFGGLILAAIGIYFGVHLTNNAANQGNQEEEKKMTYTIPAEELPHEGTWLTWPHPHTYGQEYQFEVEPIWVQMVAALHNNENVHIIAYDKEEQARIESLLTKEGIDLATIDFVIAPSDDVWVRDTGPIFVFDKDQKMTIADFSFDGWGEKMAFTNDDKIPIAVSKAKNIPIVDVSEFVLEGGSVELDGKGTLMATKSSVVSENRNSGMTVEQAESYLKQYFGVSNFIWLEGVINEDITDAHIDGMARFLDDKRLLTVSEADFAELYEGIKMEDYRVLTTAKNAQGQTYRVETLPLTKNNVKGLDYKGTYLNYYIANNCVLVPVYNDENDAEAVEIIGSFYPDRDIVPIDVTALYKYGGMIHCVTQQQPLESQQD